MSSAGILRLLITLRLPNTWFTHSYRRLLQFYFINFSYNKVFDRRFYKIFNQKFYKSSFYKILHKRYYKKNFRLFYVSLKFMVRFFINLPFIKSLMALIKKKRMSVKGFMSVVKKQRLNIFRKF